MRRRDFITGLGAALTPSIAHSQPSNATEVVKFQSASYTDFRQLVAREAPTSAVTVSATLSFPDRAQERYPALVIAHTIGGYLDVNEGWHSLEFRKAGFATLTYDSFSARGISERAVINAGVGPLAWAVVDAFMALRLLARHPKIDPGRIAIVGFSLGGEVAHLTAFEWLRSIFGSEQRRFAAHVAYYPAGVYGTVANVRAYTGAPILMLLGEKDDNAGCQDRRLFELCESRWKTCTNRGRGLSERAPCLDSFQSGRSSFLSTVRQYSTMPLDLTGIR